MGERRWPAVFTRNMAFLKRARLFDRRPLRVAVLDQAFRLDATVPGFIMF